MTAEERIESLLNRAGNTIMDLTPYHWYEDEACTDIVKAAFRDVQERIVEPEDSVEIGQIIYVLCQFGLRMNDVIERLCWALENTLDRYDKLKDRLEDFNDYDFVKEVEEGEADNECVSEQC